MKLSRKEYNRNVPRKLIKLMVAIKGLSATLAGSAYVMHHEKAAIICLVVGALAVEFINFYSEEPDKKND